MGGWIKVLIDDDACWQCTLLPGCHIKCTFLPTGNVCTVACTVFVPGSATLAHFRGGAPPRNANWLATPARSGTTGEAGK